MNIDQYASRTKFAQLPNDFNHQDGAKFKSSWDYSKDRKSHV